MQMFLNQILKKIKNPEVAIYTNSTETKLVQSTKNKNYNLISSRAFTTWFVIYNQT